ncbi:MAG: aldo/keto reductase [Anaerolineales bacterium]|nr:voltage-dependent potassium channel subunit beta [Anaerolineae bacterium]PWB51774.1 MAG: aldo/keto reductase [Anaerolineales bacterium]
MEYHRLGQSGLQISALSFGGWVTIGGQIGEDLSHECMQAAYDAGVNFFDTAESYAHGNAEIVMGNVIKKAGWKRRDLVISTKLFWGGRKPNYTGLSRKHIIEGARASLARLQMDYVDLIFCHRPDIYTPIEETVRAMNFLIDQGLAFYWGTSEWSADEIMQAYSIARQYNLIPPTMEQPEYNMFRRDKVEREFLRLYQEIGLGTTIWSPLASGMLTGKYSQGVPQGTRITLEGYDWLKEGFENEEGKQRIEKVKKLAPIAEILGISLAQMAIAWCLKNPNVSSVITGASKPEQVIENMKALDVTDKMSPEVFERIEAVLQNKPEPISDYR